MYSRSVILNAVSCYFTLRSFRKAAVATSIPKSTLHFWVCKLRRFFDRTDRKRHILHCRRRKREQIALDVSRLLAEQPFHTLKSIRQSLQTHLSTSSVARVVRDVGFSRKKAMWKIIPRDTEHEKNVFVKALRTRLHQSRYPADSSGDEVPSSNIHSPFVSLDETSFCTSQLPVRGYSKVGVRLRTSKIQRKRLHLSCAMAIDSSGNLVYRLEPGAFNGDKFQNFVKSLPHYPRGSTVVMDNVAFHKSRRVRHLLSRRGLAILFTPPYSPECNPIELFFSVVKRRLGDILLCRRINSETDLCRCVDAAISCARSTCNISSFFSSLKITESDSRAT